ncbi:MAG: hypothetical protein H7A36_00570 [Chlamydiales bacterium]|nr:hypothetical protein [Chlamydiales bacterium]
MILKSVHVAKELYLTPSRELVEEEREDAFESLFAEEYQKAKSRGKSEGEQLGYEKAAHELASLVSLLQRLSERLLEQKKRVLEQLKPEVVHFALRVCERVIRKELQEPDTFVHLINELLGEAIHAFAGEKIKIFLAPQDLETLQKHLGKVYYNKSEVPNLSFHVDELMCSGDCRIEAASGVLNADLEHVLDDLNTKIRGC